MKLTEADARILFAAIDNPTPMTEAEIEDEAIYRRLIAKMRT